MSTKGFLLTSALTLFFLTNLIYKPAAADTAHCGNITANETWSANGNVHVVTCNVTVASGVTLTISDSAIVKFDIGRTLIVDGALRVLGTSSDPVHFTSIHDDSIGGDTNGNGGASLPNWNNWRGLEFRDNSNDAASLIDNAVIRYAGYDYRGGVNLLKASPTIQNSTITGGYSGIFTETSVPNLICNNIFGNQGWGLNNSTTNTVVNAQNQWWGTPSGPIHSTNPGGTGNKVSDGVDFNPWLTSECDLDPAPSGLIATPVSQSQINLSWQDNSTNESEFHIERSLNGSTDWNEIAITGSDVTTYSNTDLSCGTVYFYRVRAYLHDDGKYTNYSNIAQAVTQLCPPPTAPTDLSAAAISRSQINLTWQDNSNDESEFKIERSTNGVSGWIEIGTVSANSTGYNNSGLFCGTIFYYRVRGHRDNDNQYSGYSNITNAATFPCIKTYHPIIVAPFDPLPRE